MSDDLNPKTFNLASVISGRDYPTHDVDVYFNESLGFSILEARQKIVTESLRGNEGSVKEIQDKLDALVEETKSSKYVVTLKAVPEKVYRALVNKVNEEYPDKVDAYGRPTPNPAGDEELTKRVWEAYISKVTSPDGAVTLPSKEDIEAIYGEAPKSVHEEITIGIKELREGPKAGFEFAAKEVDFLSHASPEG